MSSEKTKGLKRKEREDEEKDGDDENPSDAGAYDEEDENPPNAEAGVSNAPDSKSSMIAPASAASSSSSSSVSNSEQKEEKKPRKKRSKLKDADVIDIRPNSDGFVNGHRITIRCGLRSCEKTFSTLDRRLSHEKRHHSLAESDCTPADRGVTAEYRCRILGCDEATLFNDAKLRDKHERNIHNLNRRTVAEVPVHLTLTGDLVRHMITVQSGYIPGTKEKHRCEYCNYAIHHVKRHQELNCDSYPFRFPFRCTCELRFKSFADLDTHRSQCSIYRTRTELKPSIIRGQYELIEDKEGGQYYLFSCPVSSCERTWKYRWSQKGAKELGLGARRQHVRERHPEFAQAKRIKSTAMKAAKAAFRHHKSRENPKHSTDEKREPEINDGKDDNDDEDDDDDDDDGQLPPAPPHKIAEVASAAASSSSSSAASSFVPIPMGSIEMSSTFTSLSVKTSYSSQPNAAATAVPWSTERLNEGILSQSGDPLKILPSFEELSRLSSSQNTPVRSLSQSSIISLTGYAPPIPPAIPPHKGSEDGDDIDSSLSQMLFAPFPQICYKPAIPTAPPASVSAASSSSSAAAASSKVVPSNTFDFTQSDHSDREDSSSLLL